MKPKSYAQHKLEWRESFRAPTNKLDRRILELQNKVELSKAEAMELDTLLIQRAKQEGRAG
jgi:phenylpropionate dioxygenase-like ring-hydroxylating dioxygenase large terminal subunit